MNALNVLQLMNRGAHLTVSFIGGIPNIRHVSNDVLTRKVNEALDSEFHQTSFGVRIRCRLMSFVNHTTCKLVISVERNGQILDTRTYLIDTSGHVEELL